MNYINQLQSEQLAGKRVLLRVDFNTSVDANGKVEEFKIRANKATIDYLLDHGANVTMLSHIDPVRSSLPLGPLGAPSVGATSNGIDPPLDSFATIVDQIGAVLGRHLSLTALPDFLAGNYKLETNSCVLVDNIRQDPREVQNDPGFAAELVKNFDLYVNDAFASMHRNHASHVAVAKLLPAYAGLLVRKETEHLQQAIDAPREGKVLVMGGAKISTKLPVIQNFLDKAEKILIGGAIANNFFKARGLNIGASVVDDTVLSGAAGDNIVLPSDVLITNDKTGQGEISASNLDFLNSDGLAADQLIVDIGHHTAEQFCDIIKNAELVIWNGPMGLSEVESFAQGTELVANAVAVAKQSFVGGGDTIVVLDKYHLLDKMSFLSTGGGAMLDFLAGNRLPGLEALGYYVE